MNKTLIRRVEVEFVCGHCEKVGVSHNLSDAFVLAPPGWTRVAFYEHSFRSSSAENYAFVCSDECALASARKWLGDSRYRHVSLSRLGVALVTDDGVEES